ncbi:MAG: outer membrane beta-barrel protein [Thermoanaerobaculia bacterium]|nr:outer membrane beta-barrel protein [Thermoanaerobaculia bacterium]
MNRSKALALVTLFALATLAPVAAAQSGLEITPTVGYRFQSSISTDTNNFIDSVDVPESLTYGLTVEYPVHPSFNVEFLWSHQDTNLEADFRGAPPAGIDPQFADLKIDTFQIGGLWQSGRGGDKVRWYFDLLLGATVLNPSADYESLSRFSMSLGGGAKFQFSNNVGLRLGARWMPVYINSADSGYYWCDPYWGCYEYYDTNYLNQLDTHLGLSIKF